jgi:cell division protein FtsB
MRFIKHIPEMLYPFRRKIATVALGALACVLGYHAVFGANGMVVYQKKRAEYRELQMRLAEVQKENDRLAQENRALKSDAAAIEREARQQLHYTRPGEVIFVAPPPNNPPRSEQPATAQK